MRAAIKSGIPDIEAFDRMSEYSKGMLIAYWRTADKMEAFEAQKQEDEMNRKAKAK